MHERLAEAGVKLFTSRYYPTPKIDGLGTLPCPRTLGAFLSNTQKHAPISESNWQRLASLASDWNEPDCTREMLGHYWEGYRAQLTYIRPDLVIIWNNHRPAGKILHLLTHELGIPARVVERSPWPMLITWDKNGALLESGAHDRLRALAERNVRLKTLNWHRAEAYLNHAMEGNQSWWEQPATRGDTAVRKEAGIPENKTIVLFAGQVDADTQNFLYNPYFTGNLDAFKSFLAALKDRDDVFVLGKHHPRSTTNPDTYRSLLGKQGIWSEDISLVDCMRLADHVAAVNSAVLFEASLRGKSVLALGQTMLSGCGVFNEWHSREDLQATEAWLDESREERKRRRDKHMMLLDAILDDQLYYYCDKEIPEALLGPRDFAQAIVMALNDFSRGQLQGNHKDSSHHLDYRELLWNAEELLKVQTSPATLLGNKLLRIKTAAFQYIPEYAQKVLATAWRQVFRNK